MTSERDHFYLKALLDEFDDYSAYFCRSGTDVGLSKKLSYYACGLDEDSISIVNEAVKGGYEFLTGLALKIALFMMTVI